VVTVVEARSLSRRYRVGEGSLHAAVDSVTFTVGPGEFVAIEGPSGSGKSTLLGLIAGLERPDSGSVHVLGQDLDQLSEAERARLRRRRIGLVVQSHGLVAALDVIGNVSLPLMLDNAPIAEQRRRAHDALLDVGLGERALSPIDDLSGGERQRVAIARALVREPDLILADEPTGSLDEASGALVLALLEKSARAHSASLLLVTHDAASAARANRRLAMVDGRVREVSP
jgi:putative ABC transport system ATP-binding protein